ncbi:hypothetical protein HVMH_0079 [Hydrogenovibrio marinus]|nr:hypothetical protein HVMH_0079 [Hydrogenovibrio marinus]
MATLRTFMLCYPQGGYDLYKVAAHISKNRKIASTIPEVFSILAYLFAKTTALKGAG